MAADSIFTRSSCGKVNLAAVEHFREQEANLHELEAVLAKIQQELELSYQVRLNSFGYHAAFGHQW
jgi:chromosome segregation ATPase